MLHGQLLCMCEVGAKPESFHATSAMQKAKVAVGLEKPLGKEGAGSMEPAGMMENKCDFLTSSAGAV